MSSGVGTLLLIGGWEKGAGLGWGRAYRGEAVIDWVA